jgi:hypothetical protein
MTIPVQLQCNYKSSISRLLNGGERMRGPFQTILNTKEEQQSSDYRGSGVQTKVPILKSLDA